MRLFLSSRSQTVSMPHGLKTSSTATCRSERRPRWPSRKGKKPKDQATAGQDLGSRHTIECGGFSFSSWCCLACTFWPRDPSIIGQKRSFLAQTESHPETLCTGKQIAQRGQQPAWHRAISCEAVVAVERFCLDILGIDHHCKDSNFAGRRPHHGVC
jgi:hypothetical protein